MKTVATNKRARYDYELIQRYQAGLVLIGAEVKSIRAGHVSLKGSFVVERDNELFLIGAHISPYKFALNTTFEPERSRKLLLHKKEVNQITNALANQGVTAVPIAIGLDHGLIKLEFAVARGKRTLDKREVIKRRMMLREAGRELKNR